MSKITIRNLIIAIIAAAITLAALGYIIFQISSEGKELRQQISMLETQNRQEASFLKLQRTGDDTKVEREKLQEYFFFQESDSIDFLNQIESLIPNVGLKGNTVVLQEIKDPDGTNWVEIVFEVNGARQDVQNFVQTLELVPYVSRLTDVQMKVQPDGVWTAEITIQIQVLTYDT